MDELRSLIIGAVSRKYIGENENWHVEVNTKQSISNKKAEFLFTYNGNEEITGDIDVSLNSEEWSWGFRMGELESGTLTGFEEMPFFISKSDKLSMTIFRGGKEEQIALEYKGEK